MAFNSYSEYKPDDDKKSFKESKNRVVLIVEFPGVPPKIRLFFWDQFDLFKWIFIFVKLRVREPIKICHFSIFKVNFLCQNSVSENDFCVRIYE